MLAILFVGALLIAALVQAVVRRGTSASGESPAHLRRFARVLIALGVIVSAAPLVTLALDITSIRSAQELVTIAIFLLLAVALVLPSWIWLLIASQRATTRSVHAFIVGAAVANITISVVLYQGLFSGRADSQDGVVVLIVPLLQLLITAASAVVRRGFDQSWDRAGIADKV